MLTFIKDGAFSYPEFQATVPGGTYSISKPPFLPKWRANFFQDSSADERTMLTRLGEGVFDTYEAAVAACNEHARTVK